MNQEIVDLLLALCNPYGVPTPVKKEAMEQEADIVEEKGEEKANAMDDNGEIAPSETGVGDTQTK